jgi:restriction system protein
MVARVLRECGYEVEAQKHVALARGDVTVDVWADDHADPANVLAIECKHWDRPVSKHVVHGFRTVVGDSGANTGLLISSAGFQSGARAAAAYSNVRLLTWDEFQHTFAPRWFSSFMSPTIAAQTDALLEYTEPINSRVSRKAAALPAERQAAFVALRRRYTPLAVINLELRPAVVGDKFSSTEVALPVLPIRDPVEDPEGRTGLDALPDDVLAATALRPFMERLIEHSHIAMAEFDAIFGERA